MRYRAEREGAGQGAREPGWQSPRPNGRPCQKGGRSTVEPGTVTLAVSLPSWRGTFLAKRRPPVKAAGREDAPRGPISTAPIWHWLEPPSPRTGQARGHHGESERVSVLVAPAPVRPNADCRPPVEPYPVELSTSGHI